MRGEVRRGARKEDETRGAGRCAGRGRGAESESSTCSSGMSSGLLEAGRPLLAKVKRIFCTASLVSPAPYRDSAWQSSDTWQRKWD